MHITSRSDRNGKPEERADISRIIEHQRTLALLSPATRQLLEGVAMASAEHQTEGITKAQWAAFRLYQRLRDRVYERLSGPERGGKRVVSIPSWMTLLPVSEPERQLLAVVLYMSKSKGCTARNDYLARELTCSIGVIKDRIYRLVKRGYLISEPDFSRSRGRILRLNRQHPDLHATRYFECDPLKSLTDLVSQTDRGGQSNYPTGSVKLTEMVSQTDRDLPLNGIQHPAPQGLRRSVSPPKQHQETTGVAQTTKTTAEDVVVVVSPTATRGATPPATPACSDNGSQNNGSQSPGYRDECPDADDKDPDGLVHAKKEARRFIQYATAELKERGEPAELLIQPIIGLLSENQNMNALQLALIWCSSLRFRGKTDPKNGYAYPACQHGTKLVSFRRNIQTVIRDTGLGKVFQWRANVILSRLAKISALHLDDLRQLWLDDVEGEFRITPARLQEIEKEADQADHDRAQEQEDFGRKLTDHLLDQAQFQFAVATYGNLEAHMLEDSHSPASWVELIRKEGDAITGKNVLQLIEYHARLCRQYRDWSDAGHRIGDGSKIPPNPAYLPITLPEAQQ